MTISASDQEIAAATAYEALHVPAIFKQWAPHVVAAARIRSGDRVLDVACGTGVLGREALPHVGSAGSVVGLDASPGMLAVASGLTPTIDWHQGLADKLPFADRQFEAVVSQFGLMFFPDRVAAIMEMLRVLVPGGRVAVAVWDSLDNSEAYPDEVALLERVAGTQAADALRAPFVMGDTAMLMELFEGSGASDVSISTANGRARFPGIRTMVEADLRGWLPVMGVHLGEEQIALILEEAEHVLRPFVTPDGSVEFNSPAHIVTGAKP